MTRQKEVRIIYSRLQHLISQIPQLQTDRGVDDSVVEQYHSIVDELSKLTSGDYSKFKVPKKEKVDWRNRLTGKESSFFRWNTTPVRTKIFELIGQIRVEYDTEQDEVNLRALIKKELKDTWSTNKQRIIIIILILGAFLLLYIVFKVNLFSLVGVEIGI